MRYVAFSLDKLRAILKERGLKDRDLVKMIYTEKSHQTFQSIFTKTFGVKKLIDVCNALKIPMDSLFETTDDTDESPGIAGKCNNVNTSVISQDFCSLQSENEALKLLIKEKDLRIADLQHNLDMVIELAKNGQNSDA